MATQNHDPQSGRFIVGNRAGGICEKKAARQIYETLRELATPELIANTFHELLAEGGHVKRATFEMLLHYVAGKPKERLEITTGEGQTLFSIESLSQEDQASLESITLKALGGESVKIIDADFEEQKEKTLET